VTSPCRRLWLRPRPPFRLDLTAWALRRRAHNAVDRFDGLWYRRTLDLESGPVAIGVRQCGAVAEPELEVTIQGGEAEVTDETVALVRSSLEWILGLDADLTGFYQMARGDPRVNDLANRFRGLRPPRFPTLFEALVNAVVCQQVSLAVGIHLLNRLSASFGSAAPLSPGGTGWAAPAPERIAAAKLESLRELGLSRAKSRALAGCAAAVLEGALEPLALGRLGDQAARERLCQLPGIGRWSAEYVLLRGLGRYQVLPGDDVGARNSLRRRFGLNAQAGYDDVRRLTAAWRPYAGLVYFHLLLDGLERSHAWE
jgi:DNA-3-methyladenine glycosylase II